MHRFYAPIALDTVKNDEVYAEYLRQFRAADVTRVFICAVGENKTGKGALYDDPDRLARLISRLKNDGLEVGVWMNALGHGGTLAHADEAERAKVLQFKPLVGLDGRGNDQGLCPSDENLRAHFAASISRVAAMHPDVIMLDDDFRLNVRDASYDIACFCDYHMEELCKAVGEKLTREELYEKAFTGGENRYRTAWMELMRESLLGFAREMRKAVDAVAPEVRLGCCMCYDTWDMDGTDGIELARAFAGNTKPFLRTIGAPYHDRRVAAAVECTRMQAAWCKDAPDVEVFAEGDVYPRPRYTVPAAQLELFDLALVASGAVDADQKYMFDYVHPLGYERGYIAHHLKNAPKRVELSAIFEGKSPVGVQVFEAKHKMRAWDIPAERSLPLGRYIHKNFYPKAARMLAQQAIPTVYEDGAYPVIVFGESARHIPLEKLKNGAILDAGAAMLLAERGVDVGLLSATAGSFSAEYFADADDSVRGLGSLPLMRLEVKEGAAVDSLLLPDRTPGSYRYENAAGQRFFVLAMRTYEALPIALEPYQNHYHRGRRLVSAVEWVAGRKLPAVCLGNPYLYMICAESADGSALSVALFNVFEDSILVPEVTLAKSYGKVRTVNCTAQLQGDRLTLSEIPAFGFAAFEVKL